MTGATLWMTRVRKPHTPISGPRLTPAAGRLCSAFANGASISHGCGARKWAAICGEPRTIFKTAGDGGKSGKMAAAARTAYLQFWMSKLDCNLMPDQDTGMIPIYLKSETAA